MPGLSCEDEGDIYLRQSLTIQALVEAMITSWHVLYDMSEFIVCMPCMYMHVSRLVIVNKSATPNSLQVQVQVQVLRTRPTCLITHVINIRPHSGAMHHPSQRGHQGNHKRVAVLLGSTSKRVRQDQSRKRWFLPLA